MLKAFKITLSKMSFAVKDKCCTWSVVESKLNTYRSWLEFLQKVETHFLEKAFLKVRTPNLVPSGAMEAYLHPLNIEGQDLQLPTSPEFSLKKLWLSGLANSLFEVSPSFRSEELGAQHLTEFTMLEFYQANAGFEDLITLSRDFLCTCLQLETSQLKILKMNELFHTFVGFELEPESGECFLRQALEFHGIVYPEKHSWSDLFHILLIEKIEPLLSGGLIAITNYPPQLSALAKIGQDGWSERVEFFYRGVELGNGYNELLDADEIRRRWVSENEIRKFEGLKPHSIDEEFIEAHSKTELESGVGMAIGLERLFWLTRAEQAEHIGVWPFGGRN